MTIIENGKYTKEVSEVNVAIKKSVKSIFENASNLDNDSIMALIMNATIIELGNRKLLEDDPLFDGNPQAAELTTNIVNSVEGAVMKSRLPSQVIVAYASRAIFSLANDPSRKID